jgi:hypothetical protein
MTHTKGPWSLDGDLSAMNLDVVYGSGRIAMMECENDELSDDEVTANARLIAAAPDLLATLERICAAESRMSGNNPIAGLCDEARAAIAKAKGEV